MTEAEWMECTDPGEMLEFLHGKASDRKLRLFACACCRRIMPLLIDSRSLTAVEVAEQYAEGTCGLSDLSAAGETADDLWNEAAYGKDERFDDAKTDAAEAAASCTHPDDAAVAARMTADSAANAMSYSEGHNKEKHAQADLLRDIFGNPFRPGRRAPEWHTETVGSLAAGIYEQRAFDQLPILADALEDAGCTDRAILDHLRGPGVHVRGCWPVDLLLGKSECVPPPGRDFRVASGPVYQPRLSRNQAMIHIITFVAGFVVPAVASPPPAAEGERDQTKTECRVTSPRSPVSARRPVYRRPFPLGPPCPSGSSWSTTARKASGSPGAPAIR